jgi:hypothetical protein
VTGATIATSADVEKWRGRVTTFEIVCRRHGVIVSANRSDRLANAPDECPECGTLLVLRMDTVPERPKPIERQAMRYRRH